MYMYISRFTGVFKREAKKIPCKSVVEHSDFGITGKLFCTFAGPRNTLCYVRKTEGPDETNQIWVFVVRVHITFGFQNISSEGSDKNV